MCWWWTPWSCASNDSLLNTQSLSHRFGLGRRRIGVESNLGRLEIKVQMVGLECLDLNTSVGGSLSKNEWWKCSFVLMALSESKRWWRGITSHHYSFSERGPLTHVLISRHSNPIIWTLISSLPKFLSTPILLPPKPNLWESDWVLRRLSFAAQ